MHKDKTERPLHVVYLPRWYPHKYDPMPGLFIERHGLAAARHCRVSVLYVHADDQLKNGKYTIDWGEKDSLPTIRIYFKKYSTGIGFLDKVMNSFLFYRYNLKGLKLLRQRHGKPDLLHVHVLTRHGVVAWMQKIRRGLPYVITEHWTRYLPSTGNYGGTLRRWLTARVAENASAIMPVTANLRDAMIACGLRNDNYVIIPNVVDTNMFHPAEEPKKNEKKRLIHVSCFEDRQKNISGILRALKKLSGKRNDFICDMVGEGIHYDQLVREAEQLGLKDKFVSFYGLRENEELAMLIRSADLMIMFSNFENLPVVILESYASGVPVLSTDVGGIREHLDERLGMLVSPGAEQAFLESIEHLLDNLDTYDSAEIRKYAMDHFSNEVIGEQLYQVYLKAAKRKQ